MGSRTMAAVAWARRRPLTTCIAAGALIVGFAAATLTVPVAIASTLGSEGTLAETDLTSQAAAFDQPAQDPATERATVADAPSAPLAQEPATTPDAPESATTVAAVGGLRVTSEITAIVDVANNHRLDEQDVIRYTFRVTNLGVLPAHDITVSSDRLPDDTIVCSSAVAEPGATVECVADDLVTVSADDLDSGAVISHVVATGHTRTATVTGHSTIRTPIAADPATETIPGPQTPTTATSPAPQTEQPRK